MLWWNDGTDKNTQESASLVCLTAATAARERTLRYLTRRNTKKDDIADGEAFDIPLSIREEYGQKLVIYGSTQTHSIAKKVSNAFSYLALQRRLGPSRYDYGLQGYMGPC